RLDASRQEISQRGIALRDSFSHRLDRLADALSGALGSRRRAAVTSAESHRAREFAGQRLDFLFRLHGAIDVSSLPGFFQFFAQLGKAPSVRELGLLIEHLACVTQTADTDPRLFEVLVAARQA